jgi:hypothetical protein
MAGVAVPRVVTVNELLDGQVVLDIECLDRIYLSGFVNSLQTPGREIYFLQGFGRIVHQADLADDRYDAPAAAGLAC